MTLSNIAGVSTTYRDSMLKLNLIKEINSLSYSDLPTNCRRSIGYFLRTICNMKELPEICYVFFETKYIKKILDLVNLCIKTIKDEDITIVEDTLLALSKMTLNSEIINCPSISVLYMPLLKFNASESSRIQYFALLATGNFIATDEKITKHFLENGLLDALIFALTRSNIKEACWVLSNIATWGERCIAAILDKGIYEKLQNYFKMSNYPVLMEIMWILMNSMISANENQMIYILKSEIFRKSMELLCYSDVGMQSLLLDGIYKILDKMRQLNFKEAYYLLISEFEGNGWVSIIEQFYTSPNQQISGLAQAIIENISSLETSPSLISDELYN